VNAKADPGALIRSKEYRRLLVVAAFIGVLVSFVSWCFLELVHWLQEAVYRDPPSALGLSAEPWWWPLPVLAVVAMMGAMAVSILRLPLSSVVLALLLTTSAGLAIAPIIIVAVGVAFIAVESVSPARSSAGIRETT
jgi:hypothetical protein